MENLYLLIGLGTLILFLFLVWESRDPKAAIEETIKDLELTKETIEQISISIASIEKTISDLKQPTEEPRKDK